MSASAANCSWLSPASSRRSRRTCPNGCNRPEGDGQALGKRTLERLTREAANGRSPQNVLSMEGLVVMSSATLVLPVEERVKLIEALVRQDGWYLDIGSQRLFKLRSKGTHKAVALQNYLYVTSE